MSRLSFASRVLLMAAVAGFIWGAIPGYAEPEHPVGLERAAQVHERNEDRREARRGAAQTPQPGRGSDNDSPRASMPSASDPAPTASTSADPSVTSDPSQSGSSGGSSTDNRVAVCHMEYVPEPGYQLRYVERAQVGSYLANGLDFVLSVPTFGDCATQAASLL